MTEENKETLTSEEVGKLYDYHGLWNFEKIKYYGKFYGMTEIILVYKDGKTATIQI